MARNTKLQTTFQKLCYDSFINKAIEQEMIKLMFETAKRIKDSVEELKDSIFNEPFNFLANLKEDSIPHETNTF